MDKFITKKKNTIYPDVILHQMLNIKSLHGYHQMGKQWLFFQCAMLYKCPVLCMWVHMHAYMSKYTCA